MKIILVICLNIEELEKLTSALIRALKPLNARWNNRKKELVVGGTKFRFVTESQNKVGIKYDKKMNSYEFYKTIETDKKNIKKTSKSIKT